jgi:DNA polymerase eta
MSNDSEDETLEDETDTLEANAAPQDGSDSPLTWHDIALSIAASMLLRMRDEVKNRLGYTTSAVSRVLYDQAIFNS